MAKIAEMELCSKESRNVLLLYEKIEWLAGRG
jgi:hypothetical protein